MTTYDRVPFDRVVADLHDADPALDKAEAMEKYPRGHNWASDVNGKVRVFEPMGGLSIGFSSGGHTGGPYCLRCERLYCIGCNNRVYGGKCPSLSLPNPAEEDDE